MTHLFLESTASPQRCRGTLSPGKHRDWRWPDQRSPKHPGRHDGVSPTRGLSRWSPRLAPTYTSPSPIACLWITPLPRHWDALEGGAVKRFAKTNCVLWCDGTSPTLLTPSRRRRGANGLASELMTLAGHKVRWEQARLLGFYTNGRHMSQDDSFSPKLKLECYMKWKIFWYNSTR